ncbi:MAG: histidinol-phosphatase HisJ family protein [Oscillospiraceae bacterium]|nr:histidinol-phosphatase HisJ family protein [Oscillospiraceae bacterium]
MYSHIVDFHVHTDNSYDGNHSATFICEKAEFNNLRAIAFTDHCEVDRCINDYAHEKAVFQTFFEIAKVKSAFRGRFLVLNGIELGQPNFASEIAERILNSQKFDVVLGSIHNLRNGFDPYYAETFTEDGVHKFLKEYFFEMKNMCEWGNFDVLAHLTYPLRYFFATSGINVDLNGYKTEIDEILRLIAKKDIALEINSAGLRQKLNKLQPETDIVKRFKELGGKFVSVGSDAHYVSDLAKGIPEAYKSAFDAGFNNITLFQNRLPVQISITEEI